MTGVEAAAISAVVSGTLKIVGNKLAPLLIKEYNSIVGVKEDLQELHDLVEEIHVWLETTADNSTGSRQSFAWLKKLKDISYDVDDVVDAFQLESEKHDYDGDGGIVSKYLCKIPKSFVFQCKAANKIKAIKKRFSAIVKQRTDYLAITKSLAVDPPVQHTNMRTKEVLSLPNVDEESVIGRDKDKQNIISMLEENHDQQKIKIVSVIGLGGSGKTTLAKLVFNDGNIIQKHFDVRLWVHVSQEFDVKDLIQKLFDAFSDNNPGPHALPYMTKTISDKLFGKRFLIVLDDVWTDSRDEWQEFMVYLKVGAPKSRILLTTRNKEVAVTVGSTDQFHLPFLSPDDSWQLFRQSLVTPPIGWDFEFEEVGKAIVDKCGGVPLAIKVLAGALHGKERIEEWHAMRDKHLSHSNVNGNEDRVDACLRLSYFHLPSNLKHCFTICSMFPKGHKIYKEQLIDLWIAHDMITLEDGVDFLEHVGHKHFNSLLQVSFLQNVEEEHGRVTCGMHDLVHDLALSILGDEIALDMSNKATSTTKNYRYVSLVEPPEHMAPKNIFRKARAVYMPEYEDYKYVMALKRAKHLRSVMVGNLNVEGANIISQVKYLKYLAVSELSCITLPETISDVWSLQALHIKNSYSLIEIPESIGKLKMLRTLNLSYCTKLKSLPDSIGDCQMISSIGICNGSKLTVLPDSIGKLKMLRTLNLAYCTELKSLPDSIGDCQKISSIGIFNCSKLTVLPASVGKLKMLRTLNLSYCTELKSLPDSIGDCQMISSIGICNGSKLTVLPDSIGKLKMLRTLNLSYCTELKSLPDSIGDCQMISSIGIFYCSKLTVLPYSIGKLKMLSTLNLSYCTELKSLPDSIGDCQIISSIGICLCTELTMLTDSIGKLQKLRTLNLSSCQMLKCLPDSIGNCQMISSIDLSNCYELTTLPNSIGRNKMLRELRLVNTKIESLPSTITTLKNLECLDLEGCNQLVELPNGFGNLENLQVLNLERCYKLVGMPIGIGRISGLQKLGFFVVGKGEKFARISELANLSMISEELTIRGISHVMYPNDAHKACLKQRRNLQRLDLKWMANDAEEVDTKVEQDVLDALEPPSGLKELKIDGYSGRQYAWWMKNQVSGGVQGPAPFPFLRVMSLCDLPNLKNLHGLVELPCLEELELVWMDSLESISGGPFPSLVKLRMDYLPSLGELWMVAERTMLDGEEDGGCCCNFTPQLLGQVVRVGNCLTELDINDCPNLEVMPHLPPSLQRLNLHGSELMLQSPGQCQCQRSSWSWSPSASSSHLKKLQLRHVTGLGSGYGWELLQHMTALESLKIIGFSGLQTELPESLWSLTSLRTLKVYDWSNNICALPESLWKLQSLQQLIIKSCPGMINLPQTMGLLTSLQELVIQSCDALEQLPNCLGELPSLRKLEIKYLPVLTCLPQSICRLTTSLEELEIYECPGIKSLPEGIKDLTALKRLWIVDCPDLERRCEEGTGEDWHLISHIPDL